VNLPICYFANSGNESAEFVQFCLS